MLIIVQKMLWSQGAADAKAVRVSLTGSRNYREASVAVAK